MSNPCDLTAIAARDAIAAGTLTASSLLESCIERIESVDGATNAVVIRCFDRARDEAKAADAAVARGDALGSLHGLPLGVKDLNETGGVRTTYGSLLYEDHVPAADERLVAALRTAGAIVIGKTNTPEFGAGAHTINKVFGITRNPFDLARTCGGSSGGSAVALAAGMMPLATGSDTGGSLRTPAGFCGVVSIRGTPGLVASERRPIGLSTYGVQGPMARTVADASLMLSVMAVDDPRDPLSAPVDAAAFATVDDVDLGALRVAVSPDLGFAAVDDGIRAVFASRVDALRGRFGACAAAEPDMSNASRAFWYIRGAHFLASQLERYERDRDRLGDNVKSNVEAALSMTSSQIAWAMAEQTRIYRAMQGFFDSHDVLICPTCAVPPFPVEQPYCTHINGEPMETYVQWLDLVAGLTLTGHPVVQLPCGLDHTGTPFGLQIVGPRRYSERFVIGVAAALERALADDQALARPEPDIAALRAAAS